MMKNLATYVKTHIITNVLVMSTYLGCLERFFLRYLCVTSAKANNIKISVGMIDKISHVIKVVNGIVHYTQDPLRLQLS